MDPILGATIFRKRKGSKSGNLFQHLFKEAMYGAKENLGLFLGECDVICLKGSIVAPRGT